MVIVHILHVSRCRANLALAGCCCWCGGAIVTVSWAGTGAHSQYGMILIFEVEVFKDEVELMSTRRCGVTPVFELKHNRRVVDSAFLEVDLVSLGTSQVALGMCKRS